MLKHTMLEDPKIDLRNNLQRTLKTYIKLRDRIKQKAVRS